MGETRPKQPQEQVDFFISFATVDRSWARWIDSKLRGAGYSTRLDVRDFAPGTSFLRSMEAAMEASRHTIAVLSPDYLQANFTRLELESAVLDDPRGELSILVPVRVREGELPNWLQRLIHIDLVGMDEGAAARSLLAGISRVVEESSIIFPGTIMEPAADEPAQTTPRFPGSLPPLWNVPHTRNPNFTGREDLLIDLHDSLHSGQATVLRHALSGLGGVGKTQLALEYAYRYAGNYSVVWWVQSETAIATNYAELTQALGLPEASASESDVRVQAVRIWLEQHEDWLLVFDNATEPDAVKLYLPQGQSGHVIITSRYADWGDVAHGLGVEVFDRDTESVPLLLRRTSQADETAARELADELGNLPLALAQAAAYIASTGDTLTEYTELFITRRAELWAEEDAPQNYPKPVGATWSLTIDELEKEPGAKELLYLLAYLAPEPVPQALLIEGVEHLPEPLDSMVQDRLAWNRVRRAFRRYGLVEVSEEGLLVHRLVQAVTRDRLSEGDQQAWAAAAVQVVATAYPEDAYRPEDIGIWVRCAELLSHAQVTADHAEALAAVPEETGELLSKVESYLDSQGRYEEAISLSERALEISEQSLDTDHPTVASRLSNLAMLYRGQGRYEEAEPLAQKALEITEQALGSDHPSFATRLAVLGYIYVAQGRNDEALPLYQRALAIGEKTLGDKHPNVAAGLNNLAGLYRDQGRYEKAEPLYQRALAIGEKTLGDKHPAIAIRLNNLASLYRVQGRYEEAEPLYQRALQIREEVLGNAHPDFAQSLNNLASLYRDQSRYEEAEPLYQRALSIFEAALVPDHPNTQQVRDNYDRFLQKRDAAR